MNNYIFINKKPKYKYLIIMTILLIITIIFFLNTTSYDIEEYDTLITCENTCNIKLEQFDIAKRNYEYLIINNKKITIKDITYQSPYINETVNKIAQEITISFEHSNDIKNNQLTTIKLLSNKDTLLNKYLDLLIRKE